MIRALDLIVLAIVLAVVFTYVRWKQRPPENEAVTMNIKVGEIGEQEDGDSSRRGPR